MQVSSSDWISSGGAYLLMAVICLGNALFYTALAVILGNKAGSPNDGCLLGICNFILAFVGAALGFLVMARFYPYFLIGSFFGALLLPAMTTAVFAARLKRGR